MKVVFLYLALLNLFDGVATMIGLHFFYIEESNPLMNILYEIHPLLFLLLKILLSSLLFILLIFDVYPNKGFIKNLAIAASILYTIVVIFHGFWIIQILLNVSI